MTSTALKIIALILMTIDHIASFFPAMPALFHWLGRLSAPIFFFCAVEGICHTHDKKLYLKRLWKMSMLMVLVEAVLPPLLNNLFNFSIAYFNNNIFMSIFQGTLIIYLLEISKDDKKKRVKYLLTYAGYQAVLLVLFAVWNMYDPIIFFGLNNIPIVAGAQRIIFTALGSIEYMEGSLILIFVMIIFYLCRNNKKKLADSYIIYCVSYFILFVPQLPLHAVNFMGNIGVPNGIIQIIQTIAVILGFQTIFSAGSFLNSLLFVNYQWMMIFALPFLLAYNGEKGKGLKKLFYVYYPVHLIVLSIIARLL